MRIQYITNVRLPTVKAQGYAIMKMCSEFSRASVTTTLYIPNKANYEHIEDPFEYYGVERNFTLQKISSFDFLGRTVKFGRILYWIDFIFFLIVSKHTIKFQKGDVLYTRDFVIASFFSKKQFICLELHAIPRTHFFFKRALKKSSFFVVLNTELKQRLLKFGVREDTIIVSPSAVDIDRFTLSSQVSEAVHAVEIPVPKSDFIYGHIGTLKTMGMEKGITLGLQALALLPRGYTFLIVGGELEEVMHYREVAERLGVSDRAVFVGKVPYMQVGLYSARCNALVAPFPDNEHYRFFMSPLKIFEYMASKRPLITTDLPSLREVLTDKKNAVLIPPDDPQALADALRELRDNPKYARTICEQAYQDVIHKYTWGKRTHDIIEKLRERPSTHS